MSKENWKITMDAAKFKLVQQHPFFAVLLLRMRIVQDDHCPTMWTDGTRIGFNPKFVETMTVSETLAVLVHELLHVVGMHTTRRGSRDPLGWNIACDAVINDIVAKAGLTLPTGCVPPISGKLPEEIYQEMPKGPKGPKGDGQGPAGCGEVRDAVNEDGSTMTKAQREEFDAMTGVVIRQAANAAKAAGKLPAGMERMIDEALEPTIPWRAVLERFVTEKAMNDYTWSRPNRRYLHDGVYLPSVGGNTISRGGIACDTSGSMDQAMLKEVCSEALGLLSVYEADGAEAELDLYWFDHACHHQTVTGVEDIKPVGGGGTSFRCVFEKLKELAHAPAWIVMLTDGYCDDFGEDPGIPVMWILTKQRHEGFQPPFGELSHMID